MFEPLKFDYMFMLFAHLSLLVIVTKEADTSLKTEVDCRTGELLVELGGHKYPIDSEFSEDRGVCVNSEFSEDRGYCDVSQNIVSTGLCCLSVFLKAVCVWRSKLQHYIVCQR